LDLDLDWDWDYACPKVLVPELGPGIRTRIVPALKYPGLGLGLGFRIGTWTWTRDWD
jgi:hypothetical protein